ncbi:MAG: Hsp20/alpha crystallin family protein [Candidatus Krumholzibacteriia bacterium]
MDSYWNPFQELEVLRRGIDDVFASVWPTGAGRTSAFLPGRSARSYPLLNIAARDDRFVIDAFAPGLDKDSLEVTVDRNVVRISGEKRDLTDVAPERFHRRERAAGRFTRTVQLDGEIDEKRVEATYADGILHLDLPKSAAALPRKISVAVK